MRDLVVAKRQELRPKCGIVITEPLGLPLIMLVDDLFDRDGAGHRSAFTEESSRSAESVPGDRPQRVEQGRPDPPLAQQCLETGEVSLLGFGHFADRSRGAAAAEHIQLALINPRRAELARVIDPQYAGYLHGERRVAGQPVRSGSVQTTLRRILDRREDPRDCVNAHKQQPVMTREPRRFHPARETPHKVQAGSSHRTGCCRRSCAFNCSTVSAAPVGAVHAVGPANQCCSTPTW